MEKCAHCGRPIYEVTRTSPITKRSITHWYHHDTGWSWCRVYGDGWVSEKRAEP